MGKWLGGFAMAVAVSACLVAPAVSSGTPDKPSVLCWNHASPGYGEADVWVKPKRCFFLKQGGVSSADGAPVISLNWNWGGNRANGRGTLAGNMGFRAPIEVRLKRPVRNCDGKLVFSKARFKSPDAEVGKFTMRLYTCPDQGRA